MIKRNLCSQVSIFAIPSGQTSSNQNANETNSSAVDSDDVPNPLDFLEVMRFPA